jgi:uncharacterized protein (DUF4213/DUF364 family)
MINADKIYQCLLDKVTNRGDTLEQVIIGVTWTLTRYQGNVGLAMSPGYVTRTLPWAGDVCKKPVSEIVQWIRSWNGFEASIAMSCINAIVNQDSAILGNAQVLAGDGATNLRVFEHFLPRIRNSKVVVVGRYPGLASIAKDIDMTVLERNPSELDLPDPACEYVIPEADWVFLSATSIINKTFPRLAELARNSNLVLMGPSVPWLEELADFGVDYLAGIRINDKNDLCTTVMEGGGTRIFDNAVEYCVYDFSEKHLNKAKQQIAHVVTERNQLKQKMDEWYQVNRKGRFPESDRIMMLDEKLSGLDSRFKRLWDGRSL